MDTSDEILFSEECGVKIITPKTRTHDFKLDAVRLVTNRGLSRARVARDLVIGTQTLCNWPRVLTADSAPTPKH